MHALLNSALAHSASRGAESHSTLTTLLPAERGDLPPRKGAEQQLYLVHIPKTGGASPKNTQENSRNRETPPQKS